MSNGSREKTYYHRTPGARFYMPDGSPLTFSAGDGGFTTDREDIQKELDKIADVPTSHVYTKQVVKAQEEKQVVAEINQTAVGSFDAANKIAGNPETQPMHMPQIPKPTLRDVAAAGGVDAKMTENLAAAAAAVRNAGTSAKPAPATPAPAKPA